jgi:uncharacterized protein (TIGR01370 family)
MRRGVRDRVCLLVASLTLAGLFASCGGDASAEPNAPLLEDVDSWAFAISSEDLDADQKAGRFDPFDLIVMDGEDAHSRNVWPLRQQGKVVIAYLSVGTIEKGRFWYEASKPYRLDYWGDWGEWYAKVKSARFRDIIVNKVVPKYLSKGFNGLFLDNTDMVESHPGQREGMLALIKGLRATVDDSEGVLFTQNGERSIEPILPYLDGWNREDVTWTYNFDRSRYVKQPASEITAAQDALRNLSGYGLLLTATDYVKRGNVDGEAEAISNACAAGALPYVSNISLTRIPDRAFTCP